MWTLESDSSGHFGKVNKMQTFFLVQHLEFSHPLSSHETDILMPFVNWFSAKRYLLNRCVTFQGVLIFSEVDAFKMTNFTDSIFLPDPQNKLHQQWATSNILPLPSLPVLFKPVTSAWYFHFSYPKQVVKMKSRLSPHLQMHTEREGASQWLSWSPKEQFPYGNTRYWC